MNARLVAVLLFWPLQALAQGFAGLGTDADGFSVPQPNPQFEFPADHGAHPDYRIEWWYLTANLTGPDGSLFGIQWTLFRSALAPETAIGWSDPQVWFGHAAVTTQNSHFVAERLARGGIGQAGVTAAPFRAWIDDWSMAGETFDEMSLSASGPDFRYDLTLNARGPLVFQGEGGFSVKSAEGQASYYYSQPFFAVEGNLTLPDGQVPVSGQAWLDREWSSQPLSDNQTGWDWFSLSFDTGQKMMGFLLRQTDGTRYSSATWIEADGATTPFPDGAFRARALHQTEVAGRAVPTRWQVELPEKGVNVTVEALYPKSWMAVALPYWEGPVIVTGSHAGIGYLEMTGYE